MKTTAKKTKQFRKKTYSDDEDEEAISITPAAATGKRSTTTLSFDEGGGNEEVKIKKSKASKAMQRRDTSTIDRMLKIQADRQDFDSLIANAPSVQSNREKIDLDAHKRSQPLRPAALRAETVERIEEPEEAEIFTLADQTVDDEAEEEFVPLDVRKKYDALKRAKGHVVETRTASVIDEEHFDPLKPSNTRVQIQQVLNDFGEEDDQEEMEWQSEQLRRATAYSVRYDDTTRAPAIAKPRTRLELVDLHAFQATLNETAGQLQKQRADAERSLTSLRQDLALTNAEIEKTRNEVQSEAKSFEWLQFMRRYSSDLVGCLRAKQPLTYDLQEATFALLRGALHKRQQWRIEQQEDTLLSMKQQGRIMTIGDYKPVAALLEADNAPVVETDEFGRERSSADLIEGQMRYRAHARETRLQKKRTQRKAVGSFPDEQLMQQTEWDMSDTEANTYSDRCAKLSQAAGLVFRDTADEYKFVDQILARFEEFRSKYSTKYQNAYISTSLVEVLGILVKLDLLPQLAAFFLDPKRRRFDFAESSWFLAVQSYAAGAEADSRLLSNVMSEVVLPLLEQLIAHSFSPRSRSSNAAISSVIRSIIDHSPKAEALHKVVQVVTSEFELEIRRLCIPTMTTSVQPSLDSLLFMRRQILAATTILSNVRLWRGIISQQAASHLVLRLLYDRTKEALHKLLMIIMMATASNLIDAQTLEYVLDGVRSYLTALSDAILELGLAEQSSFATRTTGTVAASQVLRPAEASRLLSSMFV